MVNIVEKFDEKVHEMKIQEAVLKCFLINHKMKPYSRNVSGNVLDPVLLKSSALNKYPVVMPNGLTTCCIIY